MELALLITAAGSSSRFGSNTKKEFLPLSADGTGRTVLAACTETFLKTGFFSSCVITIPSQQEAQARNALTASPEASQMMNNANTNVKFSFAAGGTSRQESVYFGLLKIRELCGDSLPDAVLIHDGARPWVSAAIIQDVIAKLSISGAAVPAVPATDTQKQVDSDGKITAHLQRRFIYAVQTPQAFLFTPLIAAHEKARLDGCEYTDDTEIWGRYCGDVYISNGDVLNKKITYKNDL